MTNLSIIYIFILSIIYIFIFSEGPFQANMGMLKYLGLKFEGKPESEFKDFYLSYDNMCNVCSLNLLKKPLPLPPPQDKLWMGINKVIDPSVGVNDISGKIPKTDKMALFKG